MRAVAALAVAAAVWALIVAGCAQGGAPLQIRAHGRTFTPVPSRAPEYEPPDLYDKRFLLTDTEEMSGTFMSNTLILFFQPGATQAERQAAVDRVRGTVIGGKSYGIDGEYYVRIAGDSTGAKVLAACHTLTMLPQVMGAAVLLREDWEGHSFSWSDNSHRTDSIPPERKPVKRGGGHD